MQEDQFYVLRQTQNRDESPHVWHNTFMGRSAEDPTAFAGFSTFAGLAKAVADGRVLPATREDAERYALQSAVLTVGDVPCEASMRRLDGGWEVVKSQYVNRWALRELTTPDAHLEAFVASGGLGLERMSTAEQRRTCDGADPRQLRDEARRLADLTSRCAHACAYVDARVGSCGGDRGHDKGLTIANKAVQRVGKALNFPVNVELSLG